jgi:Protein of unknown function (DUF2589)
MPVSGRELATLDFGNLIGGPLNAIVEAQARSAITTANFIREVGFDKDGKVINVDFHYSRKDNDGKDQDFTLTVPFLTMLPIPYVTVDSGTIEFNAKITSITEAHSEQNFEQVVNASASAKTWFVNTSVQSKTAYQKKSSTSDREERTFDMQVRVQVRNQDMPVGTERLLTLLENVIEEKKNDAGGGSRASGGVAGLPGPQTGTTVVTEMVIDGDVTKFTTGAKLSVGGVNYTIAGLDPAHNKLLLSAM